MGEKIYVVMNRTSTGQWTIADFWGMPFGSTNFYVAQKMRREIEARQAAYHWKHRKSKIVKLTVRA